MNRSASIGKERLLLCIEWVPRILEKLVLQLEAGVIGLDGLEGCCDLRRPCILVKFAELSGGGFALACVVVGETCVPPDAGVNGGGKGIAVLVGAGLLGGSIHVDEV